LIFILLDAAFIFFDDMRVDLVSLAEGKLLIMGCGRRIAGDEVLGVVDVLAPDGRLDHEGEFNNFINMDQIREGCCGVVDTGVII